MIYNQNHINEHHIFRFKTTELNEIYAVMSVRSFIIGMIGIFIPIYLFTITHEIRTVIVVYLLMYAFEALLEYPSAQYMAHFGPKHNIALSLPILVFHFWLLWTLPIYSWPLWFISLTGAMTLALFWEGYNYDFSRAKSKKKATKQVSRMYIILAVLGAIAPFIGGTIAASFGFHFLLGLVTLLMLLAVVPLFSGGEPHLKKKIDLSKLRRQKLFQQVVSYGGAGIEASVNANFWPLLVFVIVGSLQEVGFVTSASLLLTILITYIVGKTADREGKIGYIKLGSTMTALIYLVKAFARTFVHVFFLNILTSVSHSFFTSPFMTEYYLHADEENRAEYIMLMEFSQDILRVVFFGMMYVLSFYLANEDLLIAALIIGSFATFFIGLMPDSRGEKQKPGSGSRKIKVTPMLTKGKA